MLPHSEVVSQILDEMPSDPTDLEDVVHSSLFLGRPAQALSEAARLDVWLAAHFADLMEPMELIDAEPDECVISHYLMASHAHQPLAPNLRCASNTFSPTPNICARTRHYGASLSTTCTHVAISGGIWETRS